MKVEFYSDVKKKTINPELFSSHAEAWAWKICESGLTKRFNKDKKKTEKKVDKNKITQVRKFYDKTLRFSDYIKAGEDYNAVLPYLKMLNANAAYAEGRDLITREFKVFLQESLNYLNVDNPESYELFKNFFEAFIGYYKYYDSQYKNWRVAE